jgi:hypothetical protein
MRTASCPSWCTTRHAIWDDEPDGHDGPREFGTVGVGLTVDEPLGVYTEGAPQLTPDQAREVACNLYRAAAWVEDHRDD